MRRAIVILTTSLALTSAAQTPPPACDGERVVVVPFDPVGLSQQEAREEEGRVRAALAELSGVCLVSRKESARVLRDYPGHRVPACQDVACRKKVAQAFGADWLYFGTAYGLGGGRSVALHLWNGEGTVVQRGSFASGQGVDDASAGEKVIALLREARLGRSVADAGFPGRPVAQRSHWPEVAAGAVGVAALAAGLAFGAASQGTADRISNGTTGCAGGGEAYQACFSRLEAQGRGQATTANVLFGIGGAAAAGAVVMFVLEWP